MKIRSKLLLAAAASVGAALIIGVVIYFFLHRVEEQRKEAMLVEAMLQEETELRYIAFDYLLHHERRAFSLWDSKYRRISSLMERLKGDIGEKETLGSIKRNHEAVGAVFALLVAEQGEIAPFNEENPDAQLMPQPLRYSEAILGGQLLLRTQAVKSDLLRLVESNYQDAGWAQKELALAVIASVGILVAIIIAAFLSIMGSLVRPIERLRRGTEVVGAGDLDFRIGTERIDEIGDLSRSFDRMTKFTRSRPDARIRIGWTEGEGGDAVVFVRDNGVGFDKKYSDKLFGVFQRLHTLEEFEGNGVGLANVRRIVDRHGGKTWAEGAMGEGATFYFTIPGHGGGT